MEQEKNSDSSAQSNKTQLKNKKSDDVVFITILREDRDWINMTKGKLNREQRLHQIFENYKRARVM